MAQQRTMQDIYALVMSFSRDSDRVEEGETVNLTHRVERMINHGWIEEDYEDRNGLAEARLTEKGAAIINYSIELFENDSFGRELDKGAGHYADAAVREYTDTNEWSVIRITDNEVVVENNQGDRRNFRKAL